MVGSSFSDKERPSRWVPPHSVVSERTQFMIGAWMRCVANITRKRVNLVMELLL